MIQILVHCLVELGLELRINFYGLWEIVIHLIQQAVKKTVAIRTTDLPDHHHIVSINDPGHSHSYVAGTVTDTSSGNNTSKINRKSNCL